MTWYADLSPCNYFGKKYSKVFRAVGWLDEEQNFEKGNVSNAFFTKMCRLASKPLPVFITAGFHACPFCKFTQALTAQEYDGFFVKGVSQLNVFVPGNGYLFVSPESITHYIDAHGYFPPQEFQDAVMACPEPGTQTFRKALLENGGRVLIKQMGAYK